jgi:hypothetical protein
MIWKGKGMGKEWVIFISQLEDLVEGQEKVLTIRDLSPGQKKYNAKVVRARVSSNSDTLPGADVLWVRSWTGILYPKPWAIKVIGEAGDYIEGSPHGETLKVIANP